MLRLQLRESVLVGRRVVNKMVAVFIFILGLLVGSFLNVVINRLPEGQSIIFPPSHCPECENELSVWDLFPVFSFIFLRGQCRYCESKISLQYPLVELITASLALLLYLNFGLSLEFGLYAYLTSILILSSFIDFKHHIIPNKITYPNIIIGFVLSLFLPHITIINSISGIFLPALFLLAIALLYKGGMGMGDVKFIAMIGAFIGGKYGFFAIFIASLLGSVIGIALLILKVKGMKSRVPFGPMLASGALVMIFWGDEIIDFIFNVNDYIFNFLI